MALAKYVKEMRKQHELTQVDLSEKSGVGLRFIRELEQGKQTLRLDKVNQVLNLFGMEASAKPCPTHVNIPLSFRVISVASSALQPPGVASPIR